MNHYIYVSLKYLTIISNPYDVNNKYYKYINLSPNTYIVRISKYLNTGF